MRLQKGDPRKGFESEREALHLLRRKGHPVAEVLDEGEDFIVLTDAGPNLQHLLVTGAWGDEEARQAFAALGVALAGMHRAGYAHGRPAMRDFCRQDGRVTMIDQERFRPRRRRPMILALDMVILVQTWFSRPGSREFVGGIAALEYLARIGRVD